MPNPYARDVSRIKTLDPYRLQELYKMHPCAEHVVKKLLVAGEREGGKDLDHDISDCIRTLKRWQEMRKEDRAESVKALTEYDWTVIPLEYNWACRSELGDAYGFHERPAYQAGIGWLRAPGNRHGYMAFLGKMPMDKVDIESTLERRP